MEFIIVIFVVKRSVDITVQFPDLTPYLPEEMEIAANTTTMV